MKNLRTYRQFKTKKFENNSKKSGMVPEGFNHKRGRQGVHFTLVNTLETHPSSQFQAYQHVNEFDMEQAHNMKFEFFQTLNGGVFLLQHSPSRMSCENCTYTRQGGGV